MTQQIIENLALLLGGLGIGLAAGRVATWRPSNDRRRR